MKRRRTKRRRSSLFNRGRKRRYNRGRHRVKHRRKGRRSTRRNKGRRGKGAWQRHVAAVLRRGGTMKSASKSFRR